MGKVRVTNLDSVKSSVKKRIIKASRDEDIRQGIGEVIVSGIKETSLGTPAESTDRWRKRYEKFNKTDPSYSRGDINITFTGELLQDLEDNVRLESTEGKIEYKFQHTERLHTKYKKEDGGSIGRTRSKYTEISDGIINKHGYDYMKLSDQTLKKLINFIRETIAKKLK